MTSFPFDNQSTSEDQYGKLFREFQDSGVIGAYGSGELRVSANASGMKVYVAPGLAIIRGHCFWSSAIEELPIQTASATARQDLVVLRLDPVLNQITLEVVKGDPVTGTAPTLVQTDTGVYEIALAVAPVAANATNISGPVVADRRCFVGTRVRTWRAETRPTSPRLGQLGYNAESGTWEYHNGTEWLGLVKSVAWSDVSGKPAGFTPAAHQHDWTADITGKPSTFPPAVHSHAWVDVTGKPSTFPPAVHSHGEYASAAGPTGHGYAVNTSGNTIGLRYSAPYPVFNALGTDFALVTTANGDNLYALKNHTHPVPTTVSRANGSDRPHSNEANGNGPFYAVWVDGSHNFCRNTSSIRYKENVRDCDVDPAAVLALQPRIYDRKSTEAEDGTITVGVLDEYGLIAEEVHETLPQIVTRHDGKIDAIRYDLLAVALLNVVKDQERRIAALESRLGGQQ
jgi:hypothetical protein